MMSPVRQTKPAVTQYEWSDQVFGNEQWEEVYSVHQRNFFEQVANQAQCFDGQKNELETIEEEDDEIQYCAQVEKLSRSGIMYNKRVLSLEADSLCYYSQIKAFQNQTINTLKHQPKVRISLKDIQEITIPADKPSCIRVTGFGKVATKNISSDAKKKPAKFTYVFRFANASLTLLWRNLILATQEAKNARNYIVTFENLLKHSRSSSNASSSSSSSYSSNSTNSQVSA